MQLWPLSACENDLFPLFEAGRQLRQLHKPAALVRDKGFVWGSCAFFSNVTVLKNLHTCGWSVSCMIFVMQAAELHHFPGHSEKGSLHRTDNDRK
jgi:hypothetical protein